MSRRRFCWTAPLSLFAVALSGALLGACGGSETATLEEAAAEQPTTAEQVDLYFPGAGADLGTERRQIELPADAEQRVRVLAEAVLAGPTQEGLEAPFPAEIEVAAVYLGVDGLAYVDLASPDEAPPPAAGSAEERQMVFSLVNTIAINVDEVRRVVLLWNGRQPPSFSGHLDTSRPFLPDLGLVASREP